MPGDGTIRPGKVFETVTDLDGVPAGYQDMADGRPAAFAQGRARDDPTR